MFKRVLFFIALLFLLNISKRTYGQFPYQESFRNSTAPGIMFGGKPTKAFLTAGNPVTGDTEGNGFLRLTSSSNDQTGYIYSNAAFPSKYGLKLELEYYIYGGNGADGITFFLFDATVDNFTPGAFGGSLGYAQKHDPAAGVVDLPGVSKGYLGIGLDEYGNFSNPIEGRQGGVTGPGPDGISPSSITLRGKGDGYLRIPGNYKYLTSVRTDTLGFPITEGGRRYTDSTKTGYRRILIDLKPATAPSLGYLITVKIIRGGVPTITQTVIDNYYYPEPAPENLKYGIASSTGFLTNIHEIRNVFIDVYDKNLVTSPITTNDVIQSCFDSPVNINILANDSTPNIGGILNPTSIDLDPSTVGIQSVFTVANKGTFTVNADGSLTFQPQNAMVTGPVSASYTVADSYNKRSAPASITIINKPAAPANAGPDQAISINSGTGSTTLNGSASSGNTGVWSQLSGPAVPITDIAISNPTITNLSPGVYTFRWTVSGPENCTNTDDVKIVVTNPSIPTALDDAASTIPTEPVTISPIVNDTFIAYPVDPTTLQIITNPGHGTVSIVPGTGRVSYTPNSTFSGKDAFTYTIKNTNGTVSNIATITVTVKPVGKNDEAVTPQNTAIIISVKGNDISASGTSIQPGTAPTQGTTTYNTDGTITYIPRQDFHGQDTFTYILKTSEGISSDPITVQVMVNILPVAADDVAPPTSGGPIEIDVTSNDTDSDGNVVKGTVVITEQPKNGTVTVDPVTGKVRYVPNPGYFGPDSFSYVIKDDKGGISQPGKVNITVLLPPKIGLAKAAARVEQALNGSYDIDFIFTVRNFGGDPLQNISLQDDLANAFAGSEVKVSEIKVVGSGLVPNTAYNGISNTELLSSTSTLAAGAIELVALRVNVRLISREGIFNNTAFVKGFSAFFNTEVNDQSTNGLRPDPQAEGDVSYSDPTPLELLAPPLFIPGGFSPNHDGINDLFVIQNKITKKITLEIFNRWGNRIYKSADYQNNWDGKCTEGVFMGDDVPNGTYYYVIVIEGTEKRAGYLTINR